MRVSILLFAAHREVTGSRRVDLDIPADTTPADLYDRLESDYPELVRLRPYTTFAVNRQVVSADVPLKAGDEVALLQPVSGGSRD